MSKLYAQELSVAIQSVLQASKLTRAVFDSCDSILTVNKLDESPVTLADYGAQGEFYILYYKQS